VHDLVVNYMNLGVGVPTVPAVWTTCQTEIYGGSGGDSIAGKEGPNDLLVGGERYPIDLRGGFPITTPRSVAPVADHMEGNIG
jgi:hypothetical protein